MFGAAVGLRVLLVVTLLYASSYGALGIQQSGSCPDTPTKLDTESELCSDKVKQRLPHNGLQILGERTALKRMLEGWAGRFADRVEVAANGTISFDVTERDVASDAGAQLLYELVTHKEKFVLYAGIDSAAVINLLSETYKGAARRKIRKRFLGKGYASGGRHLIATRGRRHALQPAADVFAVIALNTSASIRQTAVNNYFSFVARQEQEVGVGHAVTASAFYIHEAAENLAFAAQRERKQVLNYAAAHAEAMQREAEIRQQQNLRGGFAGSLVQITGIDSQKENSQRVLSHLKDMRSLVGTIYRKSSAKLLSRDDEPAGLQVEPKTRKRERQPVRLRRRQAASESAEEFNRVWLTTRGRLLPP